MWIQTSDSDSLPWGPSVVVNLIWRNFLPKLAQGFKFFFMAAIAFRMSEQMQSPAHLQAGRKRRQKWVDMIGLATLVFALLVLALLYAFVLCAARWSETCKTPPLLASLMGLTTTMTRERMWPC